MDKIYWILGAYVTIGLALLPMTDKFGEKAPTISTFILISIAVIVIFLWREALKHARENNQNQTVTLLQLLFYVALGTASLLWFSDILIDIVI
ncbi:MAG TPA: hypothetical protein VJG90_03860 [Candidatus Nanoarchaeia archaeon]|nr:hypothetical protein [Candidatus Nanoarchaeia archaeon]